MEQATQETTWSDRAPFIQVGYLLVFTAGAIWWMESAVHEEMRTTFFWIIFGSAIGALIALSSLVAQMWLNWKDKGAIMNRMNNNHNEIKVELSKINDTLLRIEGQRGADIASSRPWSAVPAGPPGVTSRAPV